MMLSIIKKWIASSHAERASRNDEQLSLPGAKRRGNLFLRNGLLRCMLSMLLAMTVVFTQCQAAVEFDGVNDHIDFGTLSNLSLGGTNKLSISTWANWDSSGSPIETIFGWQQTTTTNYVVMHTAVGGEGALVGVGGGYGEILTDINGWHHWLMVYNGSEIGNTNRLLFYLDGVQQALTFTGAVTSTIPNIPATAKIGSQDCCIGRNWTGLVEDFRIYDRTLTPTEVQAIYNSRSKRPSGSLANGLIAHYEMDDDAIGEVTAQTKDNSGNLNHGQFIGFDNLTTALSKDVPVQTGTGQSLEFDGINSYININDSTILKPNNLTISSWIKLNNNVTGSSVKAIIAKLSSFQGYQLIVLGSAIDGQNNELRFDYGDGSSYLALDTDESLTTNTWYHIAATLNGNNGELFVNSISKGTKSISGNINYGTQILKIGDGVDNTSRDWDGFIDDVRLYNKALTSSEISFLYNGSGLDPGTSNLQALWTFDDDSAVKDSSGNNNHGVGVGGDSLKYNEGVLRR